MDIELLAPARNLEIARKAIMAGADAVYIGSESHGARVAAANSLADIEAAARFAHIYKARVYVTLNTLVYPSELADVERHIRRLYEAGVDALIIQDMGILQLDLPPVELHASTQCDIRTPERAAMLAAAGMSRLVLPREMTLAEMAAVRSAVPAETELEAFVHGALCVSYSGDCRASEVKLGRSANRGCCAQICRLPFEIVDADTGRVVAPARHYLSLRDLNRSRVVGEMIDAGINSFKIEGRLKDEAYVVNATAAYRRILDAAIDARAGARRLSVGASAPGFEPALHEGFNRGFTEYFTREPRPAQGVRMASLESPKSIGEVIGRVERVSRNGRELTVKLKPGITLANGDGLGWFSTDGVFEGCRANRVEGSTVNLASAAFPPAGAELRRNYNIAFERSIASAKTSRTLQADARLVYDAATSTLTLTLTDEGGRSGSASAEVEIVPGRSPQLERRREAAGKLGGTPWRLRDYAEEGLAEDAFVALGVVADLRRRAVVALQAEAEKMPFAPKLPPRSEVPVTPGVEALNIANPLAEEFYRRRGVNTALYKKPANRLMTTRYCLRRELGCCLRTSAGDRLPRKLMLRSPGGGMTLGLEFDCKNCRMHVVNQP